MATISISDLDLSSFLALERMPDDDEAVIDVILLIFVTDESCKFIVEELQNSFEGGVGHWRNEVPLDRYLIDRLEWIREVVATDVNMTPGDALKFGSVRCDELIFFLNSMIQTPAVRSWVLLQVGNLLDRTSVPVSENLRRLLEQFKSLFSVVDL